MAILIKFLIKFMIIAMLH